MVARGSTRVLESSMMTIAIIIGLSVLSFFLLGLFAKSLVDAPEQADDR